MQSLRTYMLLASILVVLAAVPCYATEQPKLMIMGDDADEDSIPRHNRIFNRVTAAIQTSMQEYGFDVYDETAVTMAVTNPGRVRRSDAELISVARSLPPPPVDVIAVFQVYATKQSNAYSDISHLQVRVTARMIQVETGKNLGNFEVSVGPKGLKPLPVKCDRDCLLERVGTEAKIVAKEVGTVLAAKLDAISPPPASRRTEAKGDAGAYSVSQGGCSALRTGYTLIFQGFDARDFQTIDRMLVSLQGYEQHKPLRTHLHYSEYWYETCLERALVERSFRKLSEQLPGPNRMVLTDNKIEIEKIPLGRQR